MPVSSWRDEWGLNATRVVPDCDWDGSGENQNWAPEWYNETDAYGFAEWYGEDEFFEKPDFPRDDHDFPRPKSRDDPRLSVVHRHDPRDLRHEFEHESRIPDWPFRPESMMKCGSKPPIAAVMASYMRAA